MCLADAMLYYCAFRAHTHGIRVETLFPEYGTSLNLKIMSKIKHCYMEKSNKD